MLNLIYRITLALMLTILIELFVAFMLGYKKRRDMECIILVNIITNPVFNCVLNSYYLFIREIPSYKFIILGEFLIIYIEYSLLAKTFDYKKTNIFVLVFFMNFLSYMIGEVINHKFDFIWNLV